MYTAELAYALKTRSSNISQSLKTLQAVGAVVRLRRGVWALPQTVNTVEVLKQIDKIEAALKTLRGLVG